MSDTKLTREDPRTTMVTVWKLRRPGEGSWLAVGAEGLDAIMGELENSGVGDYYEITVEEWTKADLDALPEFDGW